MAIRQIDKQEFETLVAGDRHVLVDFSASWCGPCKQLGPILDDLAPTLSPDREIVKVDIDQCMDLARRFHVASVPTMVLFQNGKEVARLIGVHPPEDILALFDSAAR